MKTKLKSTACIILTLALIPLLSACSPKDVLLYLYGGDDFVDKPQEAVYYACDGTNGMTVVYDGASWMPPSMVQEDTLSITSGGTMDYTAILVQVTDSYTDFLAQSGEELSAETATVEYPLEFTVPDATVHAVRYDCGSYQTIFAEIDYDSGTNAYLTAATRLSDYEPIIALLQNVYPTGATPESAAALAAEAQPQQLAQQK